MKTIKTNENKNTQKYTTSNVKLKWILKNVIEIQDYCITVDVFLYFFIYSTVRLKVKAYICKCVVKDDILWGNADNMHPIKHNVMPPSQPKHWDDVLWDKPLRTSF